VERVAIIGLGNPGTKYHRTRHNLGFWLVNELAQREKVIFKANKQYHAEVAQMRRKQNKVLLVKPMSYMNESGKFLSPLLSYFECSADHAIVVHDEIAFPLGEIKVSRNKGAGGHNGVKSVLSSIGSGFARFRVGIGMKPNPEVNLADFVLSKLSAEEWTFLQERKDYLCQSLLNLLDDGVDVAMNLINQTNRSPKPS
jgi:peptidyl-tRNA hydrolase, PTH1 family